MIDVLQYGCCFVFKKATFNNAVSSFVDHVEELKYKYILVELFGANCLPLFVTILLVGVDMTDYVTLLVNSCPIKL